VFWKAVASRLDWHKNFHTTIQGDFKTGVKWFVGGKLNVSGNYFLCIFVFNFGK